MTAHSPPKTRLVAAFAAVYLIWGSTYLAIRFAIDTMPPFTMAGVRFITAGGVLYVCLRARGVARPAPHHWRSALVIGALMLLGGNGGVVWAEQFVASGIAALLVTTVPFWVVLLAWVTGRGRPSVLVVVGLLVGFCGVFLLVGPERVAGGARVDPVGALVLVLAAFAWAVGSLYSREAQQAPSQPLATAMSMLAGGVLLLLAATVAGELSAVDLTDISPRSWVAFWYLVVFGALVAFSAYIWLMRSTTPARAATYAYVNPVVAVVLGWILAAEPLNPRVVIAAGVIVGAVALIVTEPGTVYRRAVRQRRAATGSSAP
ncbi:MAG: EamA family transporter [Gemmatimonadota bacterium]|nr:MAG: EamA family transporter [Gemmatimonadota bacterium]